MKNIVLVLPANVDKISQLERLKLKYRCYYCDGLSELWTFIDAEQNNLIVPLERIELCYGNVKYVLEALHDKFVICSAYDKHNSDDYRVKFLKYYHEIYKRFADMLKNKNSANNS